MGYAQSERATITPFGNNFDSAKATPGSRLRVTRGASHFFGIWFSKSLLIALRAESQTSRHPSIPTQTNVGIEWATVCPSIGLFSPKTKPPSDLSPWRQGTLVTQITSQERSGMSVRAVTADRDPKHAKVLSGRVG